MSDTHGPTRALVERAIITVPVWGESYFISQGEWLDKIAAIRAAADALDAARSQWPTGDAAAEQLAGVLSTEFDYHRWQETGETHRRIWRKIAAAVLARLNGAQRAPQGE